MPIYTVQGPDGKTYEIEGPAGATAEQLGAVISSQGAQQPPAQQPERGGIMQQVGNLAAGAVRGAGSLGASLLSPRDALESLIARKMGAPQMQVPDRRKAMDEGLQSAGAQPDSFMYGAGKLGAEIAGTMGAGGAAANVLSKVAPGAASAAPGLIEALRSGGMSAQGAGMGTRIAGGAASGALAAGLVNPEDAGTGAMIGAAAPLAVRAAGILGKRVGDGMNAKLATRLKDYGQNAQLNKTIEDSVKAGYVIPPASVDPSMKNRVLESVSGKMATQQLASTKNADVTSELIRKGLGLPDDVALSKGALEQLRKTAGSAYKEVADLSPNAAADLEALKQARNDAQGWFKAYNRSASPEDLAKAKQFRATAESLEQALEGYAQNAQRPELIPALRDARKQIAKTYTVDRALNDASGTVDARVLGRLYEKGAPLTDEFATVGRFASAFPTVAKTPQQIGSPDAHNLRSMAAMLMGGAGAAATGGPGVLAGAVPFVAPPLARSLMFREGAQKALVKKPPTLGNAAELAKLLRNPELMEAITKASPAIAVSGQ